MAEIKQKTKDSNTFRFKSFADRVNAIDLRSLALYHIGHENEELPEDNETFFHQTLKKWMVLNLSEEYSFFSRRVLKIVTLPQLLHKKDFVVDLLLEKLACATNLSLQPLLELLYVLARDLREEFYPYFQRVLDRLICLLNTQDAEQLEWTLVCLAYLFKTLKPYLKRNIGVVFHCILPLLDERRYEEHVTNFAVECFSFIARDVRDYGKFLDFILETVAREQVESIQGCGRLLFEIMRGIKGQFHSIAADFLQFIFESLVVEKKIKLQLDLLNDIVEYTINQLLKFIHPQQMSLFWLTLCKVSDNCENPAKLHNLCRIFLQVVEFKECRYLQEMDVVVACLLKLVDKCIKHPNDSWEALNLLTQVISFILMSGSSLVTQLDTSRLLKKSLCIKDRNIYKQFIKQMSLHVQFDIFILPNLIQYFEDYFDTEAFQLLVEVIMKKQPLIFNAVNNHEWKSMDIKVKSTDTLKNIEEKLIDFNIDSNKLEDQLLLLIIAPHLKGLKPENLQKPLEKLLKSIVKYMEKDKQKLINVLALCIEIQTQLKFAIPQELVETLTTILIENVNNLKALGALNQLISCKPKLFNKHPELTATLSKLLSHHEHEKRIIAAHSLSLLYKQQENQTPYQIIYQAELIDPTVHTYREQMLHLQKLETQGELYKSFTQEIYKEDCVRFLLGLLYHNFKFVWEPVLKLLEDYAKQLDPSKFWFIYHERLLTTQENINYSSTKNKVALNETLLWQGETLNNILPAEQETILSQQELLNYRILLWQRLPHFGKLVELKNRELVTMFMKFIEDEYQQQLESKENSWNLSTKSENSLEYDINENDENNEEEEKPSKEKKNRYSSTHDSSQVKSILQTLQTKLGVFATHQNPRALYRESELWSLYTQLLKGSNQQLQRTALDCIMSYKLKALMPYKDLLYNILDEKKFKDELINFKTDTISVEHRQQFMEILLRLLYGKMITRGTQKGLSPQQRKSIILRFLGQCSLTEIEWFLQMAFGLHNDYCRESLNIKDIPQLVKDKFNIQQVWSPKKLQSVVNLLELIRKEFGGIMQEKFHYYMLKLLVFIGSLCNEVLQLDSSLIHAKMPVVFRNLKQNTIQSLYNFFTHIEEFEWSDEIINCLTEVFVYPSLEKLPSESIHTPTILLKLLLTWGEKPKHFIFLNQICPHKKQNIFHYIISLLLNEKSKALVRKPIMALVERLLVASENELEFSESGLVLIKPYIPELLQRLKMNFSTKGSKQQLDKRDLNVLSMLTKHVEEPETCDSLLQLLLPILIAKTQTQSSSDVVSQVITTLSNLIKRLEQPDLYIRKVAPLFEQVQEVSARKQLCELIADIARIKNKQQPSSSETQQLKTLAKIVLLLNAWDKRWVEQPDYEKRLDAFKEIKQQIDSPQGVSLDLGILVIYNCFYFLRYDKDMGLRENASENLRLLLPHLAKKYAEDKVQIEYLVGDVFINLIRRIIKDSHENVRNEGIRLLGEMARVCPETHEILQDLHGLGDNLDAEVDFFENMIHLQTHRHGRALLKFNSHASTLNKPPCVRTLTQFILPMASRYLLQEHHAGKHTLIDAAIETVGVVCQLLPWQHYHSILRYYLMKMRTTFDYQKQCVRIVVRILDAFHYDLSTAENDLQTLEKLKTVIKEKAEELNLDIKIPKENIKKETEVGDGEEEEEGEDSKTSTSQPFEEESLEDALEKEEADDDVEDEKDLKSIIKTQSCLNKCIVLPVNASKRVLTTITTILIPTLNRSITEKSSYDNKHKVNRKRLSIEREEEEILRVPIALALVKLMQKLPKELMESSLPGVFMKVCTFLRSPLKSVRMLTRDILKKIMLCLGSKYLSMLMDHLQNLLTRGFQVHVLSVTVHGVLDALRENIQPTDIESCLHNLLEVALNDVFGEINAEKEIDKLTSHTPEAKPSAKSFLVLHIIARNIREICLLDLLMPFKEHLARSKSRKLTLKIQESFAKIVNGLVENKHISRESLLIFIYGTMSESITDLLPGIQRRVLTAQEKEKMRRARPDCFIIQPAPRMRSGAINKQVKSNAQANAHILIEFGLEMLHIVLKRKKLVDVDYPPFLNPILPLLKDALKSTHIRVTTFALKCFATLWVEEYKLPALEEPEYIKNVVERMFEILKNFSTFGATKQEDNFQLLKAAFKAIVNLLRKCAYYNLTEEQIEELVLYIEQDLHDGENQAMTFNLLKSMLSRKVESKAIHDIMKKIGDMSIISQSDYVRDEARSLLITYIMEYPLHKRVEQIVKYFSVQLCYSLPAGRLSAIELLLNIVKKFPLSILSKNSEFLYLSFGTRLVNDDDPECRKAVANCIETMITRLEKADRQHLFDLTLLFFNVNNKATIREMGAALCSRFLNAEKQSFAPRIKLLLPTIVGKLSLGNPEKPGRFVRAPNFENSLENEVGSNRKKQFKNKKSKFSMEKQVRSLLDNDQDEDQALEQKQRALDHELIQMQYCLLKIFDFCSSELFKTEELSNTVDELAYESQRLLGHEHNWVRCNAAKIITHILSGYDFALVGRKLAQIDSQEDEAKRIKMDFIYLNPEYDIKSLVLDLCAQMLPGETSQPMIDEIVKIFLYIATMLRDVRFSVKREVQDEIETQEDNKESATKINLNWLMKNIRYLINKEVAKAPHSTAMRTALFTLIEGLITLLTVDTLELLGPSILSALVREMSEEDQNINKELRQLALRVGSRLRKRIGSDIYDKLRASAQMKLLVRRAERKKLIAQEKIHDPVRAAKRKVAVQERKKSAKKLKASVIRGKSADVKQKLKKRKRKAEDDLF